VTDPTLFNPFPGPPPIEAKGPDAIHAVSFRAAVEGADAYHGVRAAVRRDGPIVRLGNRFVAIAKYREIAFVSLGHAAVSAAYGAHDALGSLITQGFVAGPNPLPPEIPFRATKVLPGRPGQPGAAAVLSDVLELAGGLGERDLLLLLVTPGASVSMAGPPSGFDAGAWNRWLGSLSEAGASAREVAEIVRALGTGGVGGGVARAAGQADVVPLIVERGEGAVLVGGGPATPLLPTDRAAARAALLRLGLFEGLPAAARSSLSPDGSLPSGLGRNVHRPVAVAGPSDALRAAGDTISARGYTSRLAAMTIPGNAAVAAEVFLDRVDEVVTRDLSERNPKTKGLVVFAPASLEVPEGGDERREFPLFARTAAARIRRRGMTVGVYQTSALADPPGAAGVVVEASKPGVTVVPRPLGMRSGITDVGCLLVAFAPREPAG
jgi:glycerate-2-kinase